MKKLLITLLLSFSATICHAATTQIVNPFTKVGLWDLSDENCYSNNQMGVISVDGKFVGCWLKDNHPVATNDKDRTFIIDGIVYSFTLAKLRQDILDRNAWMESVAAQSLNATRPVRSQAPVIVAPAAPTYYYNSLGFPIGSSSSY